MMYDLPTTPPYEHDNEYMYICTACDLLQPADEWKPCEDCDSVDNMYYSHTLKYNGYGTYKERERQHITERDTHYYLEDGSYSHTVRFDGFEEREI
jgi:hypothetical protein